MSNTELCVWLYCFFILTGGFGFVAYMTWSWVDAHKKADELYKHTGKRTTFK